LLRLPVFGLGLARYLRAVMDRLYVKEDRREFSHLVQTLLEDWLKQR
jgi:hypothetical protein